MRQRLAALLLASTLATGCAGKQLTNRQVAVGVIGATVIVVLVVLAVRQCDKGASFCDNSPAPQ